MIKAILKTRNQPTLSARLPETGRSGSLSAVMDISGPLPAPEADPLPYLESALVGNALRRPTWRQDATDLSRLPRELDPFECDWPWIGWVEPRHRAVVASEMRSHTFEQDLQRVLAMFAD